MTQRTAFLTGQFRGVSRRAVLKGSAAMAAMTTFSMQALQEAIAQEGEGGEVTMLIRKPSTLNPLYSTSGNEQQIERLIFGALVKSDDQLQPVPDLAESVDVSPDGLTYTFVLKPDLPTNCRRSRGSGHIHATLAPNWRYSAAARDCAVRSRPD